MLFAHFCLASFHARESWRISFQVRKVYMGCTRIVDCTPCEQNSYWRIWTWRDTIRAILFLDARENGCVCNGMFLMIFARVYTCARKVIRIGINFLSLHTRWQSAVRCIINEMIPWTGPPETLRCHVIYVNISLLLCLKKNRKIRLKRMFFFFLK